MPEGNWWVWVVVLGLILVSLVLRTLSLGESLWMDEGLSIGIASQPFFDIPGTLRLDGSPPLYYMLLHLWTSVIGERPGRDPGPVGAHRGPAHPRDAVGRVDACSAAAPA